VRSSVLFQRLDLVALDQWVGEQPLAHLFDARGDVAVAVDFKLDQAADVDVRDALVAERRQRPLDGLPLRIQDSLLRPDQDPDLQRVSQLSKDSPARRS
jgi:hypothetical protein